jgi:hypothetical protein
MKKHAMLNGNIHQRAIDLDDYLESKRSVFTRDQRIAALRDVLSRENGLGHLRGWNAAKLSKPKKVWAVDLCEEEPGELTATSPATSGRFIGLF